MSPRTLPRRFAIDDPPPHLARQPFFAETLALLECVRDHDFDRLAALCDDNSGIVDIDPAGNARPIRNRVEWERWFLDLFATLDALGATTDSEVISYQAVREASMGFGVLEFRQSLTVVSSMVPNELRALTNRAN